MGWIDPMTIASAVPNGSVTVISWTVPWLVLVATLGASALAIILGHVCSLFSLALRERVGVRPPLPRTAPLRRAPESGQ